MHTCSCQDNLVVFEVVEEHRASNENTGVLEERLPDVRHWNLHGEDERLELLTSAGRATAQSRTMGPTCKHVTDLFGNVL